MTSKNECDRVEDWKMNDFIIAIENNLNQESNYSEDLFDLFGTPDGEKSGIIGQKDGKSFKMFPPEMGWGMSGWKKVSKFIYYKLLGRPLDDKNFESWYKKETSNGFPDTIKHLGKILYVFTYKKKKVPAFIAEINKMEKQSGRILFWLTPIRFFLLPPHFYEYYKERINENGRESAKKFHQYLELPKNIVKNICSSAAYQDLYRIIPKRLIEEWEGKYNKTGGRTIWKSNITDNLIKKHKHLQTNNQIFWNFFSEYIERTQISGNLSFKQNHIDYTITDIKANTINENGLVYTHEIGVPKTICEAMSTVFGSKYLDKEFGTNCKLKINDSKFLHRAKKINTIAHKIDEKFANTDYDWELDLSPIGIKKHITFDLTCGLFNKGLGKSKEEYIEQWRHNVYTIPATNNEIICIWHYGINDLPLLYKGKEVGEYLCETYKHTTKIVKSPNIENIPPTIKTIVLPFYSKTHKYNDFKKEFRNINPHNETTKKSILYQILVTLLSELSNILENNEK